MSDDRLTAEDFARLITLPEDHPERRRLYGSPEFEARMRLWREFETYGAGGLPAAEAETAARELEMRLGPAVRGEATAAARGSASASAGAGERDSRRRGPARSWLQSLFGAPPRSAVAFATVLIVGFAATWLLTREGTHAVRSAPEHAAIEMAAPRATPQGVELSWTEVPGADGYRVIFYGADLVEIARLDHVAGTHVELRLQALPPGLRAGKDALAEVTALHGEDPIAPSTPRLITPR
jgi:hypothetical protein